ncbi:MAG: hypothetical protein WB819_10310 [Terriglobia bacterium]
MTWNSIRRTRLAQYAIQVLALNLLFAGVMLASQQQQVPVPQVNANLGPCTVDFTVSEKAKQPLYNAEISVKIAYGFMGMKKMDLKVGTNNEGKARFVGLPEEVHKPPLAFVVRAKGLTKTVNYWPSVKCQARYSVVMDGR